MLYHFLKQGSDILSEPSLEKIFTSLKDGEYEMDLTRKRDQRSANQNRLLWMWLSQIEQDSHVGYTKDEWLEVFRTAFLSERRKNPLDRRKWIVHSKSTADLDTKSFNDFLEKIRLAGLTDNVGVKLMYPDEMEFEQWLQTFN